MLAAGLTFQIAAGADSPADSKLVPDATALRPLTPGDHVRKLTVGNFGRIYLVHMPPRYDPKKHIHVTGMSNGGMMCYKLAGELSDGQRSHLGFFQKHALK